MTLPSALGILWDMSKPANTPDALRGRKESLMASEFTILTPSRDIITRTYRGAAAEQFAAYVAEFPINSGHKLCHTFNLDPIEPLVVFA